MRILDADEARDCVDGLVHFDTQRAPDGLDLTVEDVFEVTGPGSLDFGGSEFDPAPRERIEPELASPDDDYGWWELDPGSYVVHYNEGVDLGAGQVGELHPLPRLQQAGASHGTLVLHGTRETVAALLNVGEGGCHLKENCRVSRLVIAEPS
ncbi:MAG: hypothetical protein Q8W44_12880 [Candidatus Palauibacterales bacterium]|nr:hypothetical protein [Candidatus Palauibacterales bacterium]